MSHTECCIFIGEIGVIYYKISGQSLVTKNSAEVEFVRATDLSGADYLSKPLGGALLDKDRNIIIGLST